MRILSIKTLVFFLAAYFLSWVLSYVVVNGDLNIDYMWEYFVLAWTFDGFVRPVVTWLLSIVTFSVIVSVSWYAKRKKGSNAE